MIAVETKYTDELGVNEASHCEEQKQMLVDTGLFRADFEELLTEGKVKYAWEDKECQTLWDDIFGFAFPDNDYSKFDSSK